MVGAPHNRPLHARDWCPPAGRPVADHWLLQFPHGTQLPKRTSSKWQLCVTYHVSHSSRPRSSLDHVRLWRSQMMKKLSVAAYDCRMELMQQSLNKASSQIARDFGPPWPLFVSDKASTVSQAI